MKSSIVKNVTKGIKMNLQQLYRHAYDGKYEYCIKTLVEAVEKQDALIKAQARQIASLESRVKRLEGNSRIMEEHVLNPALEDKSEEKSLIGMLEEFTDADT